MDIANKTRELCCGFSALLLFVAAPVRAQDGIDRFLPHVRYFAPPIADPLEPRWGLGLLNTTLFRTAPEGRERIRPFFIPDPEDSRNDVDAVTSIGGTLPLWHAAGDGKGKGVVIAAQGGVISRFRIEYPTREDVGQDWFVGMPIEFADGPWSGRFRVMHRSSHLGDELVETTGAARIEVGGEFLDFLAAYTLRPETRVYGGATWVFRSYTDKTPVLIELDRPDRFAVQAGAEAGTYPWANGHFGVVAAADLHLAQRTDWDPSIAAAAGFSARTNTRTGRFLVRYFTGSSLLEQFFLTPEKYWSLELVFDF
jgi:hypothetical protein